MSEIIGGIGPLASIIGGLGSAPANQVNLPPQFQMPNMPGAANTAFQNIGNMPNWALSLFPQYQAMAKQIMENPYGPMAQQGANVGAQVQSQVGANQIGSGGDLVKRGQSFMDSFIPGITQAAFDPRGELYGRTQQQLQDQTRASQMARGIGTTGYGAGLESKAMSDFNIDWQNQQLQRMLQGAQGAGGVFNTGQGGIQAGNALEQQGSNNIGSAWMAPYLTSQMINNQGIDALNMLSGAGERANQTSQQTIDNLLKYLQVGNQANSVMNQGGQLALNQAGLGFQQSQALGGNLGSGISGMGKWLSGKGM